MKVLFISLGCDKNLVDTEVMISLCQQAGYEITNEESQADIAVINSCSFIHDAKEESITTILETAQLKQTAVLKALIVTGCLAQRYQDEIQTEIPEVDAVLGATGYEEIVEVIEDVVKKQHKNRYPDLKLTPKRVVDRVVTTGTFMAYLKIAEGCNKHCTYCIIPKLRGPYRSIPMEKLLESARNLAEQGYKELVLVAQETTLYGMDLYGEHRLPMLLKELAKIPGIAWIRLLYCYPEEITDELIEVMANEPKVCHYIDMPIQHADDEILRRMGRRTSQEDLREVIGKLRTAVPDITIRTTLITGFPGETKEQHETMMEFVDEMEFDKLGVFTYSKEEDTPAFSFPNQVAEDVKNEWRDEIMLLQQEISFEKNQEYIGKNLEVFIEGYLYEEHVYVGRSFRDAPGVDGYVFVTSPEELISGDMVKVRITEVNEYDLIGEIV